MLWSRWREKCTWAEGTGRVLWQQSGAEELRRRKQLRQFLATGVIAYHSALCSHHCRLCPVLFALLPAWTDSGVISCQDTKAFAMMPLQTICLARADRVSVCSSNSLTEVRCKGSSRGSKEVQNGAPGGVRPVVCALGGRLFSVPENNDF